MNADQDGSACLLFCPVCEAPLFLLCWACVCIRDEETEQSVSAHLSEYLNAVPHFHFFPLSFKKWERKRRSPLELVAGSLGFRKEIGRGVLKCFLLLLLDQGRKKRNCRKTNTRENLLNKSSRSTFILLSLCLYPFFVRPRVLSECWASLLWWE